MNLLLPGIASAYLIAFARVGTEILTLPEAGTLTVRVRLAPPLTLIRTLPVTGEPATAPLTATVTASLLPAFTCFATLNAVLVAFFVTV